MSFWKRFTGVVLLLVAGFLAGVTVSSSFDLNSAADGRRRGRHGPSPLSPMFYSSLDLNAQQEQEIEEILQRSRNGLRELHKGMAPRMHEILAQAAADIEPILDEEQRVRHQQGLAEWEERHRRNVDKHRNRFKSHSGEDLKRE